MKASAPELVTADGELLHVDAESHPELFWAIRGGGGNFGVVTRFLYQLHEVDAIPVGRAFGVGLCQVLALVPGVSRSGATIVGGMAMGLERR